MRIPTHVWKKKVIGGHCRFIPKELRSRLTFDHARVVVDLGNNPDSYVQMASISVGLPQINLVKTDLVRDHENGLVLVNVSDLDMALDFYLGNMENWNRALVDAVQQINHYSGTRIMHNWQLLWKRCVRFEA